MVDAQGLERKEEWIIVIKIGFRVELLSFHFCTFVLGTVPDL